MVAETPAGSKSTAWAEMEASWHLGDPPPSWPGCSEPSMSTEWTILRKIKRRWKSDPLKVLGARESRVQGEAAGQVELLV
jgi:hypothetical protein